MIKGSSIRDSLPPDYVNGRAVSVQPSYPLQRKRSPATSNLGDNSRAGKRQKVYRPDDPLPSRESDPYDSEQEDVSHITDEVIPNSQVTEAEDDSRHIKVEKPPQATRPSLKQPSPVLGEGEGEEVAVSDSQRKETSGRKITRQSRQTRQSLRNVAAEAQEDLQTAAKSTPKPANGGARRPSNKRPERSDDISDVEENMSITPSITPSRGISDPYSDIETDLEQPTSILRRRGRVTPLRKSKKTSPISAKPKLLQYGRAAMRSQTGGSSNNSTPKALTGSAPLAGTANGDTILPDMIRQDKNVSAGISDEKSDGSVDAAAEEAAQEVSRLASESARKKRAAELEAENAASITKARNAAMKRQAKATLDLEAKKLAAEEKEKKEKAAKEAKAATAKARLEMDNVLAKEARRQAEANNNTEAAKREQAKRQEEEVKRQEAETAKKQEAEESKKLKAEDAKKRKTEKKREKKEAMDKKKAEVVGTPKSSTYTRSPGGMLGEAVARFNSETVSTTPGESVADMPPPPSTVQGRLSTSPALTRKRSEDIKTTPILPPQRSSSIRPPPYTELDFAGRRVSFAEPSPSGVRKTPSRATQSPAPVQTPKAVNGIQSSGGNLRQSKLVPPGTGAKSVTPKVSFTPSSSQAPTSGQQVKSTPTPKPRTNISAELLNTINKGSCKLHHCYFITQTNYL